MTTSTTKRPGLVSFAAIMMFIVGGFHIIYAIQEFSGASWISELTADLYGGNLFMWAIIDVIVALVAFYAGYDIWRGGSTGRWLGIIFAIISAVRWFFYIPWLPWAALIAIVIDILVIYGLSAHSEFFD